MAETPMNELIVNPFEKLVFTRTGKRINVADYIRPFNAALGRARELALEYHQGGMRDPISVDFVMKFTTLDLLYQGLWIEALFDTLAQILLEDVDCKVVTLVTVMQKLLWRNHCLEYGRSFKCGCDTILRGAMIHECWLCKKPHHSLMECEARRVRAVDGTPIPCAEGPPDFDRAI